MRPAPPPAVSARPAAGGRTARDGAESPSRRVCGSWPRQRGSHRHRTEAPSGHGNGFVLPSGRPSIWLLDAALRFIIVGKKTPGGFPLAVHADCGNVPWIQDAGLSADGQQRDCLRVFGIRSWRRRRPHRQSGRAGWHGREAVCQDGLRRTPNWQPRSLETICGHRLHISSDRLPCSAQRTAKASIGFSVAALAAADLASLCARSAASRASTWAGKLATSARQRSTRSEFRSSPTVRFGAERS